MTCAGLRQMINRRAKQAGLGRIHAHHLRHTVAHAHLSQGGNEGTSCNSLAGGRGPCSTDTRPARVRESSRGLPADGRPGLTVERLMRQMGLAGRTRRREHPSVGAVCEASTGALQEREWCHRSFELRRHHAYGDGVFPFVGDPNRTTPPVLVTVTVSPAG
jgi:hypothetical protein